MLTKIIVALVPVAAVLLLPLLLCQKSSGYYVWIWSGYVVVTSGLIVSALWIMTDTIPQTDPQDGFPMSPVGDATFGRLFHGFGFLVSIPMLLYVVTVELPWVFKDLPRRGNRIEKANKHRRDSSK